MSFSGNLKLDGQGTVLAENFNPQTGNGAAESQKAFDKGREVAIDIVQSGVVGTEGNFIVQISGHTNDNNEPQPGWAKDSISIHVTQEYVI
jgi:hypothetical protein